MFSDGNGRLKVKKESGVTENEALILTVSCSQWGILPAADAQWQSTFRRGRVLLHNRRDWQHYFWIHPQKQCASLRHHTHNTITMGSLAACAGCQNWPWILSRQDIFAVAVSLSTGRIVYISDQAASILNCKRDVFKNSKFVEFLSPQDVSVFYSFTTPYRLPSWSMCTGAGTCTVHVWCDEICDHCGH